MSKVRKINHFRESPEFLGACLIMNSDVLLSLKCYGGNLLVASIQ